MPHRALRFGATALALVAALAVAIVLFPWNAARGPIGRLVSTHLERDVTLGSLAVHWGRPVRVTVTDLAIASLPWAQEQPMLTAREAVLWFTLPSLLRMAPVRVALADARVALERNAEGEDNWHLGASRAPIGNVTVDRGTVRYVDARARADVTLALQSEAPAGGAAPALRFEGKGKLRDESLVLTGTSEGLEALQDATDPFRLAFVARTGTTRIEFDGTVVPSDVENLRGALHLTGPDLARLYPLVPTPLPWTPPYDLRGQLAHTSGRWEYRGLVGRIGDSNLKGDLVVDKSSGRAATRAEFTSTRLDTRDLGGFIGLPPGEADKRARSPSQRKAVQRREASGRALPDQPLELARLREHDVDLRFRGTGVTWSRIPLDSVATHLVLKDGVLRFDPLDLGLASGRVTAKITIDATRDAPQAQAEVEARNVELKRIFPQLASPKGTAGRFGGRMQVRSQGTSVAQMLAAMNGDAALIMRGGEASTLALLLSNLDLANAAALLMRGDETAEVHCAVAAMQIERGIATPDLFVVDTSAEVITAAGGIDFRNELYDLHLKAQSKRPSLLALRGPIVIGGTFRDPDVHPSVGPVAARVGAAIGLGVLAPPLALLPLVDFGGAQDVDCRRLLQDARQADDAVPPAGAANAAKRPKPAAPARATRR